MRGSSEPSSNCFPIRHGKAQVALPLLFAVALLCTVMFMSGQQHNGHHLHPHTRELLGFSGSQLLVNSICKHTAYPDVCVRELTDFHIPITATPLDIVSFVLQATTKRVNEAHSLATNCSEKKGLTLLEGQCASDCVELLDGVNDQMSKAISRLSGLGSLKNLASLRSSLMDVKVWLSSSLSYQTVCSDNFQVAPGSIQVQIQNNQAYLTEVLGVSLSLVDILSQVGNDLATWLGSALPPSPPFIHLRRRLLDTAAAMGTDPFVDSYFVNEHSKDFPVWVSVGERRLLQASSASAIASANVIVAKDGSGKFATIKAALDAIPGSYSGRYVIYIKQGVYAEVFNVTKDQQNITLIGDGIGKTVITGNRNVASGDYNTYRTSTVGIAGSGFYARDVTFRNTAGPSGHQAVAVRAGADYMVFYRCSFEGYQDTLYALSSRQFYRECQISGTVDFIFGNAIAVFQNCLLLARLPMQGQQNTYTAQGRKLASDISGYSFQNCTVQADSSLKNASYSVSTYLGRPWKAYSRVVFIQSALESVVDPAGWLEWNSSNPFTDTLYYGEYGNRGAGAATSKRVKWKGVHPTMSQSDASQFTVANFIAAQSWLDALQITYQASL